MESDRLDKFPKNKLQQNKLQQHQTPLVEALISCISSKHVAFYTPGHKRGAGIAPVLRDLLGDKLFAADLSELTELDNLGAADGAIALAQDLAAQAFEAKRTWFLVNGSTCGIEAAILAVCNPGDKIILPRNVHISVISGLIISGAVPIFIQPEYDTQMDVSYSITPKALDMTLKQHPDARAVMLVYPTYEGICGDLATLAQIAHRYHLPLLVDEAHGSHFCFHPQFPTSALAAGADLSVQSIHKTLGAMTQGSMLHVSHDCMNSDRINTDRLAKALRMLQSSSPSYILMAALDAARSQMGTIGKELMSQALELANFARSQISNIPGLKLLEQPSGTNHTADGFFALDPTRITVNVAELGLTGFAADDILETEYAVRAEFSSLSCLTFIITFANSLADIKQLIIGLQSLSNLVLKSRYKHNKKYQNENLLNTGINDRKTDKLTELLPNQKLLWDNFTNIPIQQQITPREAFFASTTPIPFDQASNYICAETVCPYPPGVPILIPGELIHDEAVNYLKIIKKMGGLITGCADTSLQTIQVIIQPKIRFQFQHFT